MMSASNSWVRRLRNQMARRSAPRLSRPRSIQLDFERLEDRLSPVVGSLAIPATVARGTFYDGVVALSGCSGSLLYSARHILTAAHCIGGGSNQVRFEMNRGATAINIFNNVPAGAAFQTNHPSYNGNIFRGFDVSVLRLTDQEPGFTGIANRHLIAPFGATRYDLYTATNEPGQIGTLVGYGLTGVGSTGQTCCSGVKRLGYNHITRDGGGGWMDANPTTGLLSDFDDGSAAYNTLGDPFWTGHAFEAALGQGDSGGPTFIGNQIAGVNSGYWDYNPPGGIGSWRDVNLYARVSTLAGFINGQVAGSYHLVLDMNQQVLGLDGLTENVTITAQRVGANIQLSVSAPAFSGVYYTAPAAQILSLTIRGSGDNETINLEAGLGLGTTVLGRGGNDTINVRGVNGGTTMTVDAGFGNDVINVGNGGTVSGIQGTLILNGGSGADTFNYLDQSHAGSDTYNVSSSSVGRGGSSTVSYSALETVNVNAGSGNSIINVSSTAAGVSTVINAGSGNDTINVSSSTLNLTQIAGGLTLQSGPGTDTLNIHDQNNGLSHTYTMTGSSGSGTLQRTSAGLISFTGFNGGLTVNGGSGATTFQINSTHVYTTTVNAGGGVNTLNVRATSGPLTINAGNGNDLITVGSGGAGSNINAILGAVTVNGQANSDTLIVDDRGNATSQTYNVTATTVSRTGGPATISYGTMEVLTLFVGSSTINVPSTAAGVATTVQGGPNADIFNVGGGNLNDIQGPLTLLGNGGTDTINLNDAGQGVGRAYTVTASTVARSGAALISYGTVESLTVNAGSAADTVNVQGTAAGTPVTVNAGLGNDVVNLGSATNTLAGFLSSVTVNGQGDTDTLNVNDQGSPGGHDYTLNATTVTRTGVPGTIIYGSLEQVNLRGSTASNNGYFVASTTAGTPATIFGNGADFVFRTAGTTTWTVTGFDAGNLTGAGLGAAVTFSGCYVLVGSPDDDTFLINPDQGITGYIAGNTGVNTLDYSLWTTGVLVELNNFIATNVAGVFDIYRVIGGSGHDYFHGDALDNHLIGNDGHDILLGDEGADYLQGGEGADQLYGGGGSDGLEGGNGEDLLIDGYTSYDYDVFALDQIWQEWTRTDIDYYTRIDNLRNGTGFSAYVLDVNNVFSDFDFDALLGENDLDWFWATDGFDFLDRLDPDEVLN